MSTNRGNSETLPNQPEKKPDSPFTAVPESAEADSAANPFTAGAPQGSPFKVADDAGETRRGEPRRGEPRRVEPRRVEPRRPARLPSFQVAETSDKAGDEMTSPFSIAPEGLAPTSAQAAMATPGKRQEPAGAAVQASAFAPAPVAAAPAAELPVAGAPAPFDRIQPDSDPIRQLELRAIFNVDHEMNAEEIFQRTRALPGIRHIVRVNSKDMELIEGLKQLLPNLGFGNGNLKLAVGSAPLEFIREGRVLLAVQTDGGFAPGLHETLILVARELDRGT